MGRFDRNSNSRSGGRDSGRRTEMYPAVCDQCGKDCQVPFRPSGDKPIYCSNCFEKQGSGNSNRYERRDNSRRSYGDSRDRDRGEKQMFSAICDDCGKECKVPFNPSSDKPIYCSSCFEKRGNTHNRDNNSGGSNKQNEQLELIIAKLDEIIITLDTLKKPVVKKSVAKKKVKDTKEE